MKRIIKGIDDNKVSLSTLKNLKGSLENRVRAIYRQAYKEGFEDGKESVTSEYIITCKDDPNDDGSLDVLGHKKLVRCKDCKYYEPPNGMDKQNFTCKLLFDAERVEDDYCSNGVRRGEGE